MKLGLFYLFAFLLSAENLAFANPYGPLAKYEIQMEEIGDYVYGITDLPEEVLVKIGENLDALALVKLSRTNKEFLSFMLRNDKFNFEDLESLVLLSDRMTIERNRAKFVAFSEMFTQRVLKLKTDSHLELSPEKFEFLTKRLIQQNDEATLEKIITFNRTWSFKKNKYNSHFLTILKNIRVKNDLSPNKRGTLASLIRELQDKVTD